MNARLREWQRGPVRVRQRGHMVEVGLRRCICTVSWGFKGGVWVKEVHYRRLNRGWVLLVSTAVFGMHLEVF